LTAAATLHANGITNITNCAQAASALKPIAGRFADLLFVCGIVGTGLLAIPVLSASAAYGVGEALRWQTSLECKPIEAPRFYGVITVATVLGLLMNFVHIDPVKALVWAAALNGLVSAPLMIVIMLMATNRKVMGKFKVPKYLLWTGWLATATMAVVSVGVFLTFKK
jgi:Mn2+/Fe2+ NRAMP family transporter